MTSPTARPHTSEQADEVDGLMKSLALASDDVAFDEPWQLRAFALAVAAHKAGRFPWSDFQGALIASIKEWENEAGPGDPSWSYHEHWVNAVESVLAAGELVDDSVLDARTSEVLATPANRNHHEAHYEPVAIAPATHR
ncbi:nitrile hydratase accessory protein [Aeromicrobium sp. CF3.5]|uniref:nitrile hydratase accessory protein n=1 Tax=Aeromicrobium sp. CF3.5 TaxID=3373078 RepID=UPI003EE72DC8